MNSRSNNQKSLFVSLIAVVTVVVLGIIASIIALFSGYAQPDNDDIVYSEEGSSVGENLDNSSQTSTIPSNGTTSKFDEVSSNTTSPAVNDLPPKFKDTFVQTHSTKDSVNLKVDYTTEISPGKAGWWESGVEYSRIIELQHSQTGHNGVLIATFEELNGGQVRECGFPIYISLDKGKTWSKRGFVTDTDGFSAQWMPTLYELPKKLGNLPAGTILLAGTSLGNQATRNVLYQSQDLGKTWEPYSIIAVGGDYTKGEGLYEPFLVMLDDGTLVCHYADETEKEDHSQRLVYKTTKDGKNWSEAVETVALKEKDYRPGMPVVTRLGDGRYFMVYELGNGDGYPVYCRYSSNGLDWGNKEEHGILIESNGKSLGSAPYCAWSPYGGEKGTLIVSGCYMKSGNSSTGTDYFVSNDYGKTWKTMPHPIPYNKNHSKMGYSNGFCFSKSGEYLYAVNNPEGATTGFSKIMFAAVKMH